MSCIVQFSLKHIVSGDAFFTGVGFILLAVGWRELQWTGWQRGVWIGVLLGLALIGLSSTPLSPALYAIAVLLTVFWLIAAARRTPRSLSLEPADRPRRRISRQQSIAMAVVASWLLAVTMEIPWHVLPHVDGVPSSQITIIGDSITAGIGEREAVTWPMLLRQRHREQIFDLSRMGATAKSATDLVRKEGLSPGLVIVEIGGNDVLGGTSVEDFANGLDELLRLVSRDGRPVLMFELPLPPLGNRFGLIQRRLAKKYGVKIIPKRVLTNVLFSPETTLDSIHLSQSGHEQLAAAVEEMLREPGWEIPR